MAKKKVEETPEDFRSEKLEAVSIDYGREDLNALGRAVNALIEKHNEGV